MMLSALVQELGNELETTLPQDMPGVFTLPLEEGVTMTISSPARGGIYLHSNVGAVAKGQEEILYTQALLGNLFGQGTKDAVLGLNENGSLLTLSRLIEYDIDFKEFRDMVEDFINTVDFWREELNKVR